MSISGKARSVERPVATEKLQGYQKAVALASRDILQAYRENLFAQQKVAKKFNSTRSANHGEFRKIIGDGIIKTMNEENEFLLGRFDKMDLDTLRYCFETFLEEKKLPREELDKVTKALARVKEIEMENKTDVLVAEVREHQKKQHDLFSQFVAKEREIYDAELGKEKDSCHDVTL